MSKERLEDKLVKFRQHLALGYVNMDILNQAHEIHELVMEQAERVQELERSNKQLKNNLSVYKGYYKNMIKINEDIVEENKHYREAIEETLQSMGMVDKQKYGKTLERALEGEGE